MPRHGKNPMGWSRGLAPPAPVTLTTIVFIPELAGYWAEGLDVLKLCLDSLRATAPSSAELLVLDNGSCEEVRSELEKRFATGEIDQLILSRRNLGKVGAWNVLFAAAGGELVAYCDSDVYVLPGWLEASREVLEAFPEAGVVTAQAMSRDLTQYIRSTLDGARADPTVDWQEGDDLIPTHFVASHLRGLGESAESYVRRIPRRRDVLLRRGESEAFVSGAHFQFMSRRDVLKKIFPLPTEIPFGDDNAFDERIDRAGFWRLSTTGYFVHHMGNCVPDLEEELPWLGEDVPYRAEGSSEAAFSAGPRSGVSGRWPRRLLESRPVRRFLKAVNRKSYQFLYPG